MVTLRNVSANIKRLSSTVPWNLALITLGTTIFAFGLKAVAVPLNFLSGGVSGLGLLLYYLLGYLGTGTWYLALNVPLFLMGWFLVSRRFMLYTLYGTLSLSLAMNLIPYSVSLGDHFLGAIAAGALMGAGNGITLRSLGSAGGTDILSIILNLRFNLPIGQVSFVFNLALFSCSLAFIDKDLVLYSMVMNFVTAQVTDYFLGLFNQRKAVFIVSDRSEDIAKAVLERVKRGSTFLYGRGAYTGKDKKVLLTVVNNLELRRLEEEVFSIDPEAFFIAESTFNVLGKGFSRRKHY